MVSHLNITQFYKAHFGVRLSQLKWAKSESGGPHTTMSIQPRACPWLDFSILAVEICYRLCFKGRIPDAAIRRLFLFRPWASVNGQRHPHDSSGSIIAPLKRCCLSSNRVETFVSAKSNSRQCPYPSTTAADDITNSRFRSSLNGSTRSPGYRFPYPPNAKTLQQ